MKRILIIDGNVAATRARHMAMGGSSSGEGYVATLKQLAPDVECDIVRPADEEPQWVHGVSLKDYDGAAITGSALNIYSREIAVERQIDLAKAVLSAGVPMFGSCWGLQVAVTALGGSVIRNPRGREFGFARRIMLTREGRDHPMFAGKPEVFEAATVHLDTVETLPAGAVPLACNDMGLQATEIRHPHGTFWGVQYHPEYSCAEIAATARRYADVLIGEGLVADQTELDTLAADLQTLNDHPGDIRLGWKFGVGASIIDRDVKLAELRNWLDRQVLK
jgi:GMP synthase (glutamine-hydrolysing)